MKRCQYTVKFLPLIFLVTSGICFAAPDTAMNKQDLTKLISGNTLDGHHLKKDYEFFMYMKGDGTLVEDRDEDIKPGKWHVNAKGKLCWNYNSRDKTWCRWILNNGDGTYTKVKGKKKKVRQFKVVPGNSKSL